MLRIAIHMLFGDRTKYITLVLSLAFAAMLMNQQGAIFLGLLNQATGPLQNIEQADLWVIDPHTEWVAEFRPLSDEKLGRIRSVPGVAWAEPLLSSYAIVELPDGSFKRLQMLGISRQTLAGRPPELTQGAIEDLWIPDAIIVEEKSRAKLGGINIGDTMRINDKRAIVVGFCKAKLGFESNAIVYTTFPNALNFTPQERKKISYVLVKAKPGEDVRRVQANINAVPEVVALTRDEFRKRSMDFIVMATGIGVNFGITILLGFAVGLLLSASVFYQFTIENLRHFATLKAMGASVPTLLSMVVTQALIVGTVGYGIGVGLAGSFTIVSNALQAELAAYFPWQLLVGSFAATLITILIGSLLSLRRVATVSPGVVFSGS